MTNSPPSSTPSSPLTRSTHLTTLGESCVEAAFNPNDFISYCFRGPDREPVKPSKVHADLQRFLTDHPRALVELPRDHGKTFQVCCRIVWELGLNPGLRVKVVCATAAVAAERARFLRAAIAHNPWVREVFPDLLPAYPWAADAFAVRRPGDAIGPSVAAFGIGAGSTGTRADLLVCDDVVDVTALYSRADRERAAAAFENNLMNLLEPDGRFWGLFTPWHADDLNARLKRRPGYALFRRPVGDDLTPVWPERWPRERLAERRDEVGAASFARGYRLLPVAEEETPIRPAWVRYWTAYAKYECVVLSVDPAVSARPTADATGLVVLGLVEGDAPAGRVHVLEACARRVTAPDMMELIDDFDRRWNPQVILFESNAAFDGIRELLVRQTRYGLRVDRVTQTRDKAGRVAALSVSVQNGSFRLRGDGAGGPDPGQQALFDEMTTFPFGEHDDLLDAAATGHAHLLARKPQPRLWVV